MENTHVKQLTGLLAATFFISTSGVLGRYINMPTEVIIWFRSVIALVFLGAFIRFKKINLRLKSGRHRLPFLLAGIMMAIHWVTYFYALKLSNVAIGMLALYTFPVITSLLEPLFLKTKFSLIYLVLGGMVLVGIYILAPEFTLKSSQVQGILFGLVSAVCYAVRILILKQYVLQYNGTMLMFYQVLIIAVCLTPSLFFMDLSNVQSQLPYLMMLGLVTTAIGHSLMVYSLQFFSASTASIISSVQPIFGIILAYIFLNEIPTLHTFLGGALILATVFIESVRSRRRK